MNTEEFEKLLMYETRQRIDLMQSKDYVWPKKVSKLDWIAIGACVGVSIILAFLAGVGVIK